MERDILEYVCQHGTRKWAQGTHEVYRRRPRGHVIRPLLSGGGQAVEQGGDGDKDTGEQHATETEGDWYHVVGTRRIPDPEKRQEDGGDHQDLQHRFAAKTVDEARPQPVAGNAGDHEGSVEQGDLSVADAKMVDHEYAIQRTGDAHTESP